MPISRAYFATAWSINPEMLERFLLATFSSQARHAADARIVRPAPTFLGPFRSAGDFFFGFAAGALGATSSLPLPPVICTGVPRS